MIIIWSPTADRNIDAIWEYIAQDNIDAADRMVERLRSAANILIDYPKIGKLGRANRTRELVVSGTPHILVYKTSRSQIEIARVLHGAQNYPPSKG